MALARRSASSHSHYGATGNDAFDAHGHHVLRNTHGVPVEVKNPLGNHVTLTSAALLNMSQMIGKSTGLYLLVYSTLRS